MSAQSLGYGKLLGAIAPLLILVIHLVNYNFFFTLLIINQDYSFSHNILNDSFWHKFRIRWLPT